MKKILATIAISLFFSAAYAQDIASIKNQVMLSNFNTAKSLIDKAIVTSNFEQHAEAWLLRCYIYIALYKQAETNQTYDEASLKEAMDAFAKYQLLDPSYKLLAEPMYNYPVSTLYFAMYDKGGKAFNDNDWANAYKKLSLAVTLGDIMIATKMSDYKLDTASILYAGAAAQYLKYDAEAFAYYKRLADKKISGSDNEFLYQFVTQYYMIQSDEANYKLYTTIAKSLYPNSKFFITQDAEHEKFKNKPYDFQMQQGGNLLAELQPGEGKEVSQKTLDELEPKMIAAFDKAAHLKPAKAGTAYTYIGNHYIMKCINTNKKITDLQEQLKTADNAAAVTINTRIQSLGSDYHTYSDMAIRCFSDAAAAFAKQTALTKEEKEAYKNDVNYLVQLHGYLKNVSAQNDAKLSTWHAEEEKKWNALLITMK